MLNTATTKDFYNVKGRKKENFLDTKSITISSPTMAVISSSPPSTRKMMLMFMILSLSLCEGQHSPADEIVGISQSTLGDGRYAHRIRRNSNSVFNAGRSNADSHSFFSRLGFPNFLRPHTNYNTMDDELEQDADADDDDDRESRHDDYYVHDIDGTNSSGIFGVNNRNDTNTTNCAWYTLSHYIDIDSTLYDTIEGFFIALLACLIFATCYNYCYYCCLTRCGCCPDDRIYTSLLNSEGRRRRRELMAKRHGGRKVGGCCGGCLPCCKGSSGRGMDDGKGIFMPIDSYPDSYSDDDEICQKGRRNDSERRGGDDDDDDQNNKDDDSSSLSVSSALSLEYGDEHLHNEYGEVTSRWDDEKIETAAREYFSREEKETQQKQQRQQMLDGTKDGSDTIVKFKKRKIRRTKKNHRSGDGEDSVSSYKSGPYGDDQSHRSRRSRGGRSRRSGRSSRSIRSHASSILSSESERSDYSYASSDSGTLNELEMEDAMMDLELVERQMVSQNGEAKDGTTVICSDDNR